LKVVVLASFAESLTNFRNYLLQAMVVQGHQVYALAPEIPDAIADQVRQWGVTPISVNLCRTGMNPLADWRSYRSLFNLFREIKPDRIFSYTVKPVIYGSLAAHRAGVPEIYSMITGLGYAFMGRTLKDRIVSAGIYWLYRRALRVNCRVFFQNRDDRDLFLQLGLLRGPQQAVIVNGSGINLDYFQPVPLPEAPVFLLVARLLKDKGILEYVAAAGRLKKKYPESRFLLVGWYDFHPTAIQPAEVELWQKQQGIEYLGYTDDVRVEMSKASVYVLPSYREGTPRTVLEAMAMGRSIITTNVPGCRETVVDGDNGFLVPMKSVDALVQAMERFIEAPILAVRMGVRSRQIAEDKYDVHRVNEVMLREMGL